MIGGQAMQEASSFESNVKVPKRLETPLTVPACMGTCFF